MRKIRKIAEVSHISFLFGAGTSDPFIKPIPQIEEKMNSTEEQGNTKDTVKLKREFFTKVMEPCLDIAAYSYVSSRSEPKKSDLTKTYESYRTFLFEITRYLLSRKSTLLDKQVNFFTTNIDIFLEKVLEDAGANYNDGFIGHLAPSFRTSHFQTIVKKKSEYSERQSEIPTFNLYKLHGSLTWMLNEKQEIAYSDLTSIRTIKKLKKETDFDAAYSKLQIINPNRKKFETTVLESTFYELLRLYATELEKENVLMVVTGFSFGDSHILQITRRAMDSNPTLTVVVLSHSEDKIEEFRKKFEGVRYSNNLHIFSPQEGKKGNLDWMVENIASKLDQNTIGKGHVETQ